MYSIYSSDPSRDNNNDNAKTYKQCKVGLSGAAKKRAMRRQQIDAITFTTMCAEQDSENAFKYITNKIQS